MSKNLTLEIIREQLELTPNDAWKCSTITEYGLPAGHDSKFVAHVVQKVTQYRILQALANSYGYVLEDAPEKVYPDFTLSRYDENGDLVHRIAVDNKSTPMSDGKNVEWRRSNLLCLGSYQSHLRDGTSSILYPVVTYDEHMVLIVAYKRLSRGDTYRVLSTALRHKHEITGLRRGSFNTRNIGSVTVNSPDGFATVCGPFCVFSKSKLAADHYWRNFERYQTIRDDPQELLNHPDFAIYR